MSSEIKTFFLVVMSCRDDEYNSPGLTNKDGSFTREGAEALIRKYKEEDQKFFDINQKLSDLLKAWVMENPAPDCEKTEVVPRWAAGLAESQITPEMRAERNGINARNNAKYERYKILNKEWSDRKEIVKTKFLTSLNVPLDEQKGYGSFYSFESPDDFEYSIEEITIR